MFGVTPDALNNHANWLDQLADKVAKAGEKGGDVPLGGETFGLVGQMFAGQAEQVAQQAVSEIAAFSEAVTKLGDGVRACAEDYASTDDGNAVELDKIRW